MLTAKQDKIVSYIGRVPPRLREHCEGGDKKNLRAGRKGRVLSGSFLWVEYDHCHFESEQL